jgi:hypothetical protein
MNYCRYFSSVLSFPINKWLFASPPPMISHPIKCSFNHFGRHMKTVFFASFPHENFLPSKPLRRIQIKRRISCLVSFFWAASAKMVTSHKVTIFVPSCDSALWNTGSARNLTLTITSHKQCEHLGTCRSLPVFARLTAWWRRYYLLVGCILQVIRQ